MFADFLLDVFAEHPDDEAILRHGDVCLYRDLRERVEAWAVRLDDEGIRPGQVVSLEADFFPEAVAAFLALIHRGCVLVPLTSGAAHGVERCLELAQVERRIRFEDSAAATVETARRGAVDHPLLLQVRAREHPALILFSSGSSGESKASLHDFVPLLEKYRVRRKKQRMIGFLLFDHIGGVNTLFHSLSNGGCLVVPPTRRPEDVAACIEAHRVEVLPTSPTLLNLLLLSKAWTRHDLSSLKLITYGTEPMPQSTLSALARTFPDVRLQQTYGLSELGILRSRSRSSDSLWMKVGGEGYETRVVDGALEIKAHSAMLGYLNAPSPFTEDGWLKTGDMVEVDGEWMKVLGRRSEMINVGGEKLFPAEVESVLTAMNEVEDAVVRGEPNAITGSSVTAYVKLRTPMELGEFRKRMRRHCQDRIERFKIPQKVVLVEDALHTDRYKKVRRVTA